IFTQRLALRRGSRSRSRPDWSLSRVRHLQADVRRSMIQVVARGRSDYSSSAGVVGGRAHSLPACSTSIVKSEVSRHPEILAATPSPGGTGARDRARAIPPHGTPRWFFPVTGFLLGRFGPTHPR